MGILKSYFTYLGRNRLFALVNVLGLSVSLMFVLLIGDMVVRQLTVGHDIKDRNEIYVLTDGVSTVGHYVMGDMLQSRYPEIKDWCAVNLADMNLDCNGNKFPLSAYVARNNFFPFMGIDLIAGDMYNALIDPNSIVLTESYARRLFGTDNPIGQKVTVMFPNHVRYTVQDGEGEMVDYTVSGVVRDFDNSLIPDYLEAVLPFDAMDYISSGLSAKSSGTGWCCTTILARFHENADPHAKEDDMQEFLHGSRKFPGFPKVTPEKEAALGRKCGAQWLSLGEVYQSDAPVNAFEQSSESNLKILKVFGIVGLAILLMAVLNYVSMSVAQTANRAKEMATRRLLGTGRWGIAARMVGEAMVMIVMAFALAFLLALAAEPFAVGLLQTKLDLAGDLSWWVALAYVLLMVVIGLLSGLAPATILSSYSPMDVVRGTFRRKTKMVWLRLLYVVQGGLSIAMLACVMFVSAELDGILSTPLGYEYGNILRYGELNGDISKTLTFKREVEGLPFVIRACMSSGNPAEGTVSIGRSMYNAGDEEVIVTANMFFVDTSFIKMFDIDIDKGQTVDVVSEHSAYFSRLMFDTLKFEPGETDYVRIGDSKMMVRGLFEDFVVRSVLDKYVVFPQMIVECADDELPWLFQVLVETSDGDRTRQRAQLDSLYAEVFEGMPFESRWYDDLLNDSYENVFRLRKIVGIFACVALLITLLGLTAMSLYFIAQRRHDMAIRKVFGSDSWRETAALIRFAMSSLAFGAVLSVPLMWFGIIRMDDMIGYDAPFSWWIPLAAFAVVAAVSLLSVWLISRKAVRENPVENLKTE